MSLRFHEETPKLRVVVAGGSGFIGSHLCRRLLDYGHEVIAVDSLVTGARKNVADLLQNPRFSLVERDILRGIVDAVRKRAHRVYNLACPASPQHYQRDPIHTTLTNVLGTHSCLKLAERWGARCLLASTSEVYGDPEVHPQPESYRGNVSSIGPRACYDEGKRCAESLLMDFRRTKGLPIRLARLFNTYGPNMAINDGRVVSNFIVQALRNENLTVYGDGSQTRSLCYVDDMIDGLVGLMEQSPVSGPMNLGNPEELSVLEIAERVIAEVGRGKIVRRPLPEDDPKRRKPDIRMAEKAFGFRPKVPFKVGLRATIDYFDRQLSNAESSLASAG
jgi:UDP-glucuronate decarboxylase